MTTEQNESSCVDDVPPNEETSVTQNEADVSEEKWIIIKNDLQDFLWRVENPDNPAFDDKTIYEWIDHYAKAFDKFYKEERTIKPELLLKWWMQSKNGDAVDAPEFVREWSAYKDHMSISAEVKESVTA